jgi:hypothetical protein
MRGDSKALGFLYDTVLFLRPAVVSWDRLYRGLAHDPITQASCMTSSSDASPLDCLAIRFSAPRQSRKKISIRDIASRLEWKRRSVGSRSGGENCEQRAELTLAPGLIGVAVVVGAPATSRPEIFRSGY